MNSLPADSSAPAEFYVLLFGGYAVAGLLLVVGVVYLGFWVAHRLRAKPKDTTGQTK